jgi:hypothetical protein
MMDIHEKSHHLSKMGIRVNVMRLRLQVSLGNWLTLTRRLSFIERFRPYRHLDEVFHSMADLIEREHSLDDGSGQIGLLVTELRKPVKGE